MKRVPRWAVAILLLVSWGSLSGCSDKIVYRDGIDIGTLPAGAGEFLGYTNVGAKRTACGNCHVGKQADWQETKHASAWYSLANSGASQASCEGCHSVNALGNVSETDSVGYLGTKSARYKDVQCESCHGPGLTHVLNPDVPTTKPLAALNVGLDLKRGCGECHSGTHTPFAEEWSASRHARVVVSRATNPSCSGCHEAKAVLQAWGVKSTFLEQSSTGEHMAITCAVCHDPHDKTNAKQLRFPMDVPSLENNLCMKCHYKRAAPELASSQGPHSPQGPMLLGDAGWLPPNFAYPPGSLVASHGTEGNPRLCASCHVNSYTVNDATTGAFDFAATGHSFQPTPCVNGAGIPTGSTTCTDAERSFRSCTTCHLTENAARTALTVARMRLDRLASEIAGMLPSIPASEFSTTDNRISTGEGARFNMQLAQQKGTPAHNPFLAEALLLASIKQIELDYGLKPGIALDLAPQLVRR